MKLLSTGALFVLALAFACAPAGPPRDEASLAREEGGKRLGGEAVALDTSIAMGLSRAFRAAAERALPAVALITVEQPRRASRRIPQQFRRYFGIPQEGFELRPQHGTGSGFIFDETGYVLTSNHVVEGASYVAVQLLDGREFEARVVEGDPSTDIAVLRIDPGGGAALPAAPLRDSDLVRVEDWVLALGNRLGLAFTVAAGIVSAKGRQLTARAAARRASSRPKRQSIPATRAAHC